MLMPAVFLIVILLGSIAIDFGVVHLRRRELDNAAAAAANDAAGAALDIAHLRATGERRLDPARAVDVAHHTIEARRIAGLVVQSVEVVDPLTVTVTVELTVQPVLGRVVQARPITLRGTQTASLEAP